MANSEEYWLKRERENIKREEMNDEEVMKQLRRIINQAIKESEKEIEAFYGKYASNNEISKAEAKKRVSEMDIRDFEETAARYVREKNFSEKANEELMTYNTKMKVNRQELLMMYLNAHLVAMANEQVNVIQTYLEQAATSEVARQAGILGANITLTTETLLSMVGASFYGTTWSKRIWDDMEGLRDELESVINKSIIKGQHPYQSVKKVRERFDVSTYEAKRILITEVGRVQIDSQKLSYEALAEDSEEQEYEYVAKLDERTSKICRGLNGKVFKVKDMQPGTTAPPVHPFCRSSTRLIIPNWREDMFSGKEYIL